MAINNDVSARLNEILKYNNAESPLTGSTAASNAGASAEKVGGTNFESHGSNVIANITSSNNATLKRAQLFGATDAAEPDASDASPVEIMTLTMDIQTKGAAAYLGITDASETTEVEPTAHELMAQLEQADQASNLGNMLTDIAGMLTKSNREA